MMIVLLGSCVCDMHSILSLPTHILEILKIVTMALRIVLLLLLLRWVLFVYDNDDQIMNN